MTCGMIEQRFAVFRVWLACCEKYDPLMMYDSERNIAGQLGSETETF